MGGHHGGGEGGTLCQTKSKNGEKQQGGWKLISNVMMMDDIQLGEPAGSGHRSRA